MPAETHLHLARGYEETLAAIVGLIEARVEHIEMHFKVGEGELDDASALELEDPVAWSATGMLRGGTGLVIGEFVSEPMGNPFLGAIGALAVLAGQLGVRVVVIA